MSNLLAAVEEYYKSQGWHYDKTSDNETLFFRLNMKAFQGCLVTTTVKEDSFQTKAHFMSNIPEEKREAIMELITRINYTMRYGAFKMDLSDGELLYANTHYCGASVPDIKIIEFAVDLPYLIMDRYAPGIMKVLYSGQDVKSIFDELD